MEKQSVVLRVPKVLLSRVDKFKEERGFGTRTQAIFYLINYALEEIQRGENTHD
jgi:metal-responsive CopG/Arc/MetJ family transcriptional regulator